MWRKGIALNQASEVFLTLPQKCMILLFMHVKCMYTVCAMHVHCMYTVCAHQCFMTAW